MQAEETNRASGSQLAVIAAGETSFEALLPVLSQLTPDFPAPILLLQRLDGKRAEQLTTLIQRRCALPIERVYNRSQLQPGTLYLVPTQWASELEEGALSMRMDQPQPDGGAVDSLLGQAAALYGENLTLVLLGRAAGAAGAVEVSNAGGTVIAQGQPGSPGEAAGIPPSIVSSIVPLDDIGAVLVDLVSGVASTIQENRALLASILEHVNTQANIDFRAYKTSTLLRRVSRRMAITHHRGMAEYLEYLSATPAEVGELVQAFLINVTQFFRDAAAFEFLAAEVLPPIIAAARRRERVLRFWSAGCATGEEPYTLAMLLADQLGDELPEWSIKIFATDLDEAAINFARVGAYPENLLRSTPPSYRERFFERTEHGYRIVKTLRQMVIFGHQDLSRNAPFPRMDLVLCRNVLIYFTPELQDYVLNQFAFSLRPHNGYLFLGKAELIRAAHTYYETLNKQWKIYRCLGDVVPAHRYGSIAKTAAPLEQRPPRTAAARPASKEVVEQSMNSLNDVTQLRRFNEMLLRFLPVGVVVIDRAYRLITANAAARRLLSLHELNNEQDFLHAVRGIPYSEVRKAIDSVFREQATVTLPEVELETAHGGNGRYLLITLVPMHVEPGLSDFAAISISDITEQVHIRQHLEAAQREQSQLAIDLGIANKRLSEINKELIDANEELQVSNEEMMQTYEELQSTNEEFEATNEELQATNEELETSNEELQATNEELQTTNDELRARTNELQQLSVMVESERVRLAEMVELAPFHIMVLQGPNLVVEALNPHYARALEDRKVHGKPLEEIAAAFWPGLEPLALAREVYFTNTLLTSSPLLALVPDENGGLIERLYAYTIVPTHNAAGMVDGVVMYAIDETTQQQLSNQAERDKLRLVFEHVGQTALALYDAASAQLLFASPSYHELIRRLHALGPDELAGQPWSVHSLISPPERAQELWDAALQSGQTQTVPELEIAFPGGIRTSWSCTITPIQPQTGEPAIRYVLLAAVEVTNHVAARQNLEQLDRMRDEFLMLASHELRSPLAPLMGYASSIKRLLARPEKLDQTRLDRLARLANSFQSQLERMNRLVSDLVDAGRLQTGKLALDCRPVDLRGVVEAAAELSLAAAPQQSIQVSIADDRQPLIVEGDADRLIQVVLNLLQNAIKYAGNAPIELRLFAEQSRPEQPAAIIEVQDHGPGIAPEHLPHLWTRFYQVDSPGQLSQTGLGLGLFIARHLVEQHGGAISVQSIPGEGSTFRISLPRAEQ
jgi:two-component system CheB/CheR fusion protein